MIISLRLKNFYSIKEECTLDFTAESSGRKNQESLADNLIDYNGDKFINIIGLFGGNAAGKTNMIKAFSFCRNLILRSHQNNEGSRFEFEPFKFDNNKSSEFQINFVTEGTEYDYSFSICGDRIVSEELYHYPKRRRSLVFQRKSSTSFRYGKGVISRPKDIEQNIGPKTLFLSRASSMNRPIAQLVYRFFLNEIVIGSGTYDIQKIKSSEFNFYKPLLLTALTVSDSDIVDIQLSEQNPDHPRLLSFHRENPTIPFDFDREESDGTKRLISLLLLLLRDSLNRSTIFMDEFDLKLHLKLAEFILNVVRASRGAQMVFTSHNPMLINSETLRPEQIVVVDKRADGSSEFIPLSDFHGINKITDIRKAYLQGRFDGVPYVGNIHTILNELFANNERTEE